MKNSKTSSRKGIDRLIDEQFTGLKEERHGQTFPRFLESLEERGRIRRYAYLRLAASFAILILITLACTVPVSSVDQMGYALKGHSTSTPAEIWASLRPMVHSDEQIYLASQGDGRGVLVIALFEDVTEDELEGIRSTLGREIGFRMLSAEPLMARQQASVLARTLREFNITVDPSWNLSGIKASLLASARSVAGISDLQIGIRQDGHGQTQVYFTGLSSKNEALQVIEKVVRENAGVSEESAEDTTGLHRELNARSDRENNR